MQTADFSEILDQITQKDPRYHRDAYGFLREALEHTQKKLAKAKGKQPRHISGQELLDGIREFALTKYGPMTMMLLENWGLHQCEDFGEIVFNLVQHNVLQKTDKDRREDFAGGYDFYDAFREPFLPARKRVDPANTPLTK